MSDNDDIIRALRDTVAALQAEIASLRLRNDLLSCHLKDAEDRVRLLLERQRGDATG